MKPALRFHLRAAQQRCERDCVQSVSRKPRRMRMFGMIGFFNRSVEAEKSGAWRYRTGSDSAP
jgi:hypothetical protein